MDNIGKKIQKFIKALFDNSGEKIKLLSVILFFINSAIWIALGIIALTRLGTKGYIGLIYILLGPILSWITSIMLYGFGEIISNSKKEINSLPKNNKGDFHDRERYNKERWDEIIKQHNESKSNKEQNQTTD